MESLKILDKDLNTFLDKNDNILGLKKILENPSKEITIKKIEGLGKKLKSSLGEDSKLYQEFVKDLILEPIGDAFQHFERATIQVGDKLSKDVSFEMFNGSVKFYRPPYKPLISSLIHAFRNAVDHGIESNTERKKAKKKILGKIEVHFKTRTVENVKWILIKIEDDGRGIDPNIIGPLAVDKGVLKQDELDSLNTEEVIQLVMAAGFSSKEEATDMSGRGVGLDAIKYEAEKLKGKAWVESTIGKGTKLFVEVPLIQESKKTARKIT